MNGRVLIVAGSDSGGGAGIQADIKTVTALGGYAMTALTALTAQNTQGVSAIHEAPPDFVAKQMRVVITDLGVDAIKIGMLHRPQVIEAVCQVIAELAADVPLVVDPVMVAKGGARLLEDAAVATLRQRLIPGATLITPNLPEAAALVGADLADGEMLTALRGLGARAVLLKGGHAAGPEVIDRLISDVGVIETFSSPRLATRHTHGTGCTLSSAIATGLAQGLSLSAAVARGRRYVIEAIRTPPGYGHGHGPLNHGHTVAEFLP